MPRQPRLDLPGIAMNLVHEWVILRLTHELGMREIRDHILSPIPVPDTGARIINLSARHVNPIIIELRIINLHIGWIKTNQIYIMGIIEKQAWEIIPICLEDHAPLGSIRTKPLRCLSKGSAWS